MQYIFSIFYAFSQNETRLAKLLIIGENIFIILPQLRQLSSGSSLLFDAQI